MGEAATSIADGPCALRPDELDAVVLADLEGDRVARLEPLAGVVERVDVNPDVGHGSVMMGGGGNGRQAQPGSRDRGCPGWRSTVETRPAGLVASQNEARRLSSARGSPELSQDGRWTQNCTMI